MSVDSTIATPDVQSCIVRHGAAALAALDSLSPADPDTSRKLTEVMGQFVRMRDELIAAQRHGASCRTELERSNALISSIFGVEFPVAGVQWQRVCDTRDALRQLVNDAAPAAARRGT
jgi:hypothetical protein